MNSIRVDTLTPSYIPIKVGSEDGNFVVEISRYHFIVSMGDKRKNIGVEMSAKELNHPFFDSAPEGAIYRITTVKIGAYKNSPITDLYVNAEGKFMLPDGKTLDSFL